jgi:simple sugar transport system permease protein
MDAMQSDIRINIGRICRHFAADAAFPYGGNNMQRIFQNTIRLLLTSLLAILIACLICSVMLVMQGYDPMATFDSIIYGAVGNVYSILSSISAAMPLAIAALGVAVAFKSGIYNIGAEGQLFVGGMCAAIIGTNFEFLPIWIHLPLCMIAALFGGALWALIPALMKIKLGFN